VDQDLALFSADEVDGRNIETLVESDVISPLAGFVPMETPIKRKPGRPPKRPESMLSGLGSPPAPRILPLPTHNPKERLNLPKPAYRNVDTFAQYEQDGSNQANYVDKSMAHVGYQEGDRFDIPKHTLIRHVEGPYDDDSITGLNVRSDKSEEPPRQAVVFNVEYDMDEQDERWLEMHNARRKEEQAEPIKPALFEITMTQIEREYYALEKKIPKPNPRHAQITRPRSSSAAAVNGEPSGPADEPDTKCAVCDDGDCENANAIIFCDGCDLAVHQECYGVPFIPEGQWFCRKCKEIGRGTPTCVFCPNVDGAFKQTNTLRWSHLLCALWIPEITIANMDHDSVYSDNVRKSSKSSSVSSGSNTPIIDLSTLTASSAAAATAKLLYTHAGLTSQRENQQQAAQMPAWWGTSNDKRQSGQISVPEEVPEEDVMALRKCSGEFTVDRGVESTVDIFDAMRLLN